MSLELLKLVETFSDIITSLNITKFEQFGSNLRLRARIAFIDGSDFLFAKQYLTEKQENMHSTGRIKIKIF